MTETTNVSESNTNTNNTNVVLVFYLHLSQAVVWGELAVLSMSNKTIRNLAFKFIHPGRALLKILRRKLTEGQIEALEELSAMRSDMDVDLLGLPADKLAHCTHELSQVIEKYKNQ